MQNFKKIFELYISNISFLYDSINSNIIYEDKSDKVNIILILYFNNIYNIKYYFKMSIEKILESDKILGSIICEISEISQKSFSDYEGTKKELLVKTFESNKYSQIESFFINSIKIISYELKSLHSIIPKQTLEQFNKLFLKLNNILNKEFFGLFESYISRYIFDDEEYYQITFQLLKATCEVQIEFSINKNDKEVVRSYITSDYELYQDDLIKVRFLLNNLLEIDENILDKYIDNCYILLRKTINTLKSIYS